MEASESQMKLDFVRSTERSLKYEPELNPLFDDFAEYYGTAIVPARAWKPRDKALFENAVTLVYQQILLHFTIKHSTL